MLKEGGQMEEYTNSETSKDEQPSMTLENEGGTE